MKKAIYLFCFALSAGSRPPVCPRFPCMEHYGKTALIKAGFLSHRTGCFDFKRELSLEERIQLLKNDVLFYN